MAMTMAMAMDAGYTVKALPAVEWEWCIGLHLCPNCGKNSSTSLVEFNTRTHQYRCLTCNGAPMPQQCDWCGFRTAHLSIKPAVDGSGDHTLCRRCVARYNQEKREYQAKPAPKMPAVNWNVHTIWDARDKQVRLYSGTLAMVRLYGDGWAIASIEGMDIWGACAFLNNMRAYIDN